MAQQQTLEELKAGNEEISEEAAEVKEDAAEAVKPEIEEKPEETGELASEEKSEDDGKVSADDNQEWMQSDDVQQEKKFTDGDIGKFKTKLTSKLNKRHDGEMEALRVENEALKSKQSAPTDLKMPRMDDFLGEDNQNEAFLTALADYNQKVSDARAQASSQALQVRQRNDANQVQIKKGVDEHLTRVAELSIKSGITADQYRGAELQVRELVDDLYPEAGDALVDAFISKVGVGSEKVFYNLGVNTTKRAAFRAALENDPSGVEASIFLGELKSQLNNPPKRKTNTPAPAEEMRGDKFEKSSTKAMKKEYEKASKANDMQAQFNIRRKAKAAGIATNDINKW